MKNSGKAVALCAVALFLFSGADAQIKIACIGNSITYGGLTADPATQAYPAVLGQLLGTGVSVQNDGVSSTTMLKNGDFSYWTHGKLPDLFAFKPDIVTIKLGTNDTRPANWDSYGAQFKDDYLAMIDTLSGLSPRPSIYLVLPVPSWANAYGIRDSVMVNHILPIIRQIAVERSLPVIDCYTPFVNLHSMFPDNIHPAAAGEDSLAHIIFRALPITLSKPNCFLSSSIGQNTGTIFDTVTATVNYAGAIDPIAVSGLNPAHSWLSVSVIASVPTSQKIVTTVTRDNLPHAVGTWVDTLTCTAANVTPLRLKYIITTTVVDTGLSLMGFWSFSENTGAVSIDSSPAKDTALLRNTSWVTGVRGAGIRFGTSGARASIPGTLTMGSYATIACWVKPDAAAGNFHVFLAKGDKVTGHFELYIATDGTCHFYAPELGDFSSGRVVDNGAWHFVAVVRKNTRFSFYVDGSEVGVQTLSSSAPLSTINDSLILGSLKDGTFGYQGSMDELRMYGIDLSTAQLDSLYASGLIPTGAQGGVVQSPSSGSVSVLQGRSNSSVQISFKLAKEALLGASVYDLMGNRVAELLALESRPSGSYTVAWGQSEGVVSAVRSGYFLLKYQVGNKKGIHRIIITR